MSNMLSSWKEIAQFFGKGVRTVQRWEKTLDLPIHRPPGAPSNVVLARESDLEAWMHRGLSHGEVNGVAAAEELQHSFDVIHSAIREVRVQGPARSSDLEILHERVEGLRSEVQSAREEIHHRRGSIAA